MSTVKQDLPIGCELPSIVRKFTQEKMNQFAGQTGVRVNQRGLPINTHTDEAFAKSVGLPGTVAQSLQYYAYVSEMLCSALGEGWLRGGKLGMKFLNMVLAGDTVTCRAVVKEKVTEGDAVRVSFEVWCENQRGEKVAVGTASGLVR